MISTNANILQDVGDLLDQTGNLLDDLNQIFSDENPNKMNVGCLMKHCAAKVPAAMVTPNVYREASCELGCNPLYYSDTTPEKLSYQNCTTKCALTYESKAMDELMACAMTANCIEFAPIDVTCPVAELTAAIEPGSSLASLKGEWWQHYGKNALWDCYPCQHIHEMKLVDDADWCA